MRERSAGGVSGYFSIDGAIVLLLLAALLGVIGLIMTIAATAIGVVLIVLGVLCFIDMRNNRGKSSDLRIEKPEPFTGKQKLNLALIFIMMLIVLGAPILSNVFSDVT